MLGHIKVVPKDGCSMAAMAAMAVVPGLRCFLGASWEVRDTQPIARCGDKHPFIIFKKGNGFSNRCFCKFLIALLDCEPFLLLSHLFPLFPCFGVFETPNYCLVLSSMASARSHFTYLALLGCPVVFPSALWAIPSSKHEFPRGQSIGFRIGQGRQHDTLGTLLAIFGNPSR